MQCTNNSLIYKYYSPTIYNLDALLNRYFWFSKREFLNDPFDIANFEKGKQTLSLHNAILEKSLVNTGFTQKGIEQLIPEYAICSFSRNELNKQMWAYYAKDYSGWCLAFKKGKHKWSNISPIMPVIYVDDLLNPTEIVNDSIYGNDPIEIAMRKLFCTKHISWKHENEERIVMKTNKKYRGGECPWDTFELLHITIGHKMDNAYKSIIQTIANAFNVPVYEISLNNIDFQLNKQRLE